MSYSKKKAKWAKTDYASHIHACRTLPQPQLWLSSSTASHRPATAFSSTHIQDSHQIKHSQPHPLLLLGWQRHKVTSAANTTVPRFMYTSTSVDPPSTSTTLLPPSITAHIPVPLTCPIGRLLSIWSNWVLIAHT